MGPNEFGIQICEAHLCHSRVRSTKNIRAGGKILLESKMNQSYG